MVKPVSQRPSSDWRENTPIYSAKPWRSPKLSPFNAAIAPAHGSASLAASHDLGLELRVGLARGRTARLQRLGPLGVDER